MVMLLIAGSRKNLILPINLLEQNIPQTTLSLSRDCIEIIQWLVSNAELRHRYAYLYLIDLRHILQVVFLWV
jgi:hypothetical protein